MKKLIRIAFIIAGLAVALAGPIATAVANENDSPGNQKDCYRPGPSICLVTSGGVTIYEDWN
jgi:hypothetical protein